MLSYKEKWVIGRAVVASMLGMIIVPTHAGPINVTYAATSVFGIILGAYFAMPIQRLVIFIERKALTRNQQGVPDRETNA
jgi:hypothetical protein